MADVRAGAKRKAAIKTFGCQMNEYDSQVAAGHLKAAGFEIVGVGFKPAPTEENSMGFHAPQETARILAEAIDYARQGQLVLRLDSQNRGS